MLLIADFLSPFVGLDHFLLLSFEFLLNFYGQDLAQLFFGILLAGRLTLLLCLFDLISQLLLLLQRLLGRVFDVLLLLLSLLELLFDFSDVTL